MFEASLFIGFWIAVYIIAIVLGLKLLAWGRKKLTEKFK